MRSLSKAREGRIAGYSTDEQRSGVRCMDAQKCDFIKSPALSSKSTCAEHCGLTARRLTLPCNRPQPAAFVAAVWRYARLPRRYITIVYRQWCQNSHLNCRRYRCLLAFMLVSFRSLYLHCYKNQTCNYKVTAQAILSTQLRHRSRF